MADLVGPAEQQVRLQEVELVLRVGVAACGLAPGEVDEVLAHRQRLLARQHPMGKEKAALVEAADGIGGQRPGHAGLLRAGQGPAKRGSGSPVTPASTAKIAPASGSAFSSSGVMPSLAVVM